MRTFKSRDAKELRHQMYAYLIVNGFSKDKDAAKILLKKFGFLTPRKKELNNKEEAQHQA